LVRKSGETLAKDKLGRVVRSWLTLFDVAVRDCAPFGMRAEKPRRN
jgi:hypothetical protein